MTHQCFDLSKIQLIVLKCAILHSRGEKWPSYKRQFASMCFFHEQLVLDLARLGISKRSMHTPIIRHLCRCYTHWCTVIVIFFNISLRDFTHDRRFLKQQPIKDHLYGIREHHDWNNFTIVLKDSIWSPYNDFSASMYCFIDNPCRKLWKIMARKFSLYNLIFFGRLKFSSQCAR